MSQCIKSEIERVKDGIFFLEDECDFLHYEVYVRHRERRLLEYELTLRDVDKSHYELERLEKKYKIELSKERYRRAHESQERILETLTSQLQRLIQLENAKKVKGDEIAMEVEHIEDTNTDNQLNEDDVVVPDSLSCMEHDNGDVMDAESHVEQVSLVQEKQVVVDIVEVEHIDFIIPETCLNLRLQANFQSSLHLS